ncbi:DUF3558 family protein [Streptomyces sp. MAR4 CNX-425]|uniref:DUF3558 family protein n=1 Tax=Streptomyces sp. MAR4 CNX-425 TaxID=3406343 RepID=UPI003B5057AD
MLLLAVGLFVAGCGGSEEPSQGPSPSPSSPSPSRSATPAPVSLSVTPEELRGADPCKLINEDVLAEYGKVEYDRGISYGQCDIQVNAPDAESVSVFVDLQDGPSDVSAGAPAPTSVLRDGVTVYESEDVDALSGSNCTRDVVVREQIAAVGIGVYGDESVTRACRIADNAAGDVSRLLKAGDLPSARHAPDSLANQDACELIKEREAARLPDIDPGERHAAFAGQSCSWGGKSIDERHVTVYFQHVDDALEGSPLTVGGRPAAMRYSAATHSGLLGTSLPACTVNVEYAEGGPTAKGRTEVVSVGVAGELPEERLCSLARELAPKALSRLPGA